jgi:hypothetical protein
MWEVPQSGLSSRPKWRGKLRETFGKQRLLVAGMHPVHNCEVWTAVRSA